MANAPTNAAPTPAPLPGEELLRVRDLSVSFAVDEGTLTAVDRVSFTLRRGELLGLVGESGCGKSVTALSLLRLLPMPPARIASGQALFAGQDLLAMPLADLRKIRGRRISMIFQEPMTALSPLHRVGKQLIEAIRIHRPEMSKAEARDLACHWLDKVGIPDAAERFTAYPFEFSGGMRQRVMIAMALLHHPDLVIADEPTTALDVTIQAQIFEIIREMIARDTSLLLITHDMGVVWELCHRLIVMYASRIAEEGPVKPVFANPMHPYTRGLLSAVPKLTDSGRRLTTIPGQVPSPLNYPKGCHFADRCPFVMARCRQEKPPLYPLAGGRTSACFLAEPFSPAAPLPPDYLASLPMTVKLSEASS
jgi:oligopeptide/dipeptide ABC transporter ATP-binding protein